jgi:hypothetical protein
MRSGHPQKFFYVEGGAGLVRGDAAKLTPERLIGDIAIIFHWPLSELRELPVGELLMWQNIAVDRWNAMHPPPKES